MKYDLK